eukprot:m.55284 g.55284  ORF g.55284 m.55284 type:complete len:263 (+) comp11959_c0_seq1:70-858(+)
MQVSLNSERLSGLSSRESERLPLVANLFEPVRTLFSTSVVIASLVGLEGMMFAPDFPIGYEILDDGRPFPFLCLLHVALWVLLVVCGRYHEHCHRRSRLRGYLSFYRETQLLRKAPLAVASAANAAVVLLATAWPLDDALHLRRLTALQIVYTIELAVSLPCCLLYAARVLRFNRRHAAPDVQQDLLCTLPQRTHAGLDPIADTNPLAGILEKQSDMIHYYRGHVADLSAQIARLSSEVQSYRRSFVAVRCSMCVCVCVLEY